MGSVAEMIPLLILYMSTNASSSVTGPVKVKAPLLKRGKKKDEFRPYSVSAAALSNVLMSKGSVNAGGSPAIVKSIT